MTGKALQYDGAPHAAPRFFSCRLRERGWSLVELVIVLIVASTITYFVIRTLSPRDSVALQQAERLRSDLRHVQMLAMTWNQPLRITAAATGYSVSCVTAGAAPCNASPIVDPANGQPFSVSLQTGLSLAGPGSLDIDALGRPRNGATLITANATYTIGGGSAARSVTVAPITGFVTAQ